MRRPQEPLSQRRLLAELKRAIDLGREDLVRVMVYDHPRGVESAYVQHNLGRARARALGHLVATTRSFDAG